MLAHHLSPLRIAISFGLILSVLRFVGCRPLALIDVRAVDYRLRQRGRQAASPEVVIVAIDDVSLERLGRWPWSRNVIAQILDQLVKADPAVIGFDIVQSEPTADTQIDALRERFEGVDDRTWTAIRGALTQGATQDRALVEAVHRTDRTVLGYFFNLDGLQGRSNTVRVSAYNVVHNSRSGKGEEKIPLALFATANLPDLTAASREVGYFNFIPDVDGSFRRVPLAIRYGDQVALPLSLAMLRVYRPALALTIRFADFGVESVHIGPSDVPVAPDGQMLINYRGPAKSFRYVSAADVWDGSAVAAETFRGRLVLVGPTAPALADVRVTPFEEIMPGVEIHANILDNLLRGDFLVQPRWTVLVEIAVILIAVLMLGVALHYLRGVAAALVTVALVSAYLVSSQWLFVGYGLPLSLVYPLLAIGLPYAAISVLHYVVEERTKRKIRDAFALYLTPYHADLVADNPDLLKLGGDTQELTVLFSDIRGFTTISEQFQRRPKVLVELLNEFLGGMTEVILAHEGYLDKYVGDEIVAVWGAPVPKPDHAARACRAALDMVPRLRELNDRWQQRGWPALSIGIGLNTGEMVVGNIGSDKKLNYSVIGDNVNLGARLEGLTKLYGSGIIASEMTLQAANGSVVAREIDLVRVKGKHLPVRIFEILAPGSEREQWRRLVEPFEAGLAAYRQRRWDDAIAMFTAVLDGYPDDGPARLYLGRCRGMLDAPPAADWDGVTTMEVK